MRMDGQLVTSMGLQGGKPYDIEWFRGIGQVVQIRKTTDGECITGRLATVIRRGSLYLLQFEGSPDVLTLPFGDPIDVSWVWYP